jgi:hypothetical protein
VGVETDSSPSASSLLRMGWGLGTERDSARVQENGHEKQTGLTLSGAEGSDSQGQGGPLFGKT